VGTGLDHHGWGRLSRGAEGPQPSAAKA
jgi:hypothetical protein